MHRVVICLTKWCKKFCWYVTPIAFGAKTLTCWHSTAIDDYAAQLNAAQCTVIIHSILAIESE